MGVFATYCMVCGLPVQHDHYVATDRENFWAIYRSDNHPPGHFTFGPEHDWLLEGVAISIEDGPHFGSCSDGCLTAEHGKEYYVGSDYEDYMALHRYCWEAAGEPRDYNLIYHYKYSFERSFLKRYQEQLFAFAECCEQGDGWLLIDPRSSAGKRNRDRIQDIIKAQPEPLDERGEVKEPETVAELVATDVWMLEYARSASGAHEPWRFRRNVPTTIEKALFPHAFWLIMSPGETSAREIDRFEKAFYTKAQDDGLAVALATAVIQGKIYFVLQTRDPDSLQALLSSLNPPGEIEIQAQEELDWEGYFQEIFPHIKQLRAY